MKMEHREKMKEKIRRKVKEKWTESEWVEYKYGSVCCCAWNESVWQGLGKEKTLNRIHCYLLFIVIKKNLNIAKVISSNVIQNWLYLMWFSDI
jgi:hypothetical protein